MAKKSKSKDSAASLGKKGSPITSLNVDPVADPVFESGNERNYLSTSVPAYVTNARAISKIDLPFLAILLLTGLYVRLHNLEFPNSVVFDEVHFGGFSKKYVLGKFFMDVHPPLAKMLFAVASSLGGFDGSFDFASIGDVFPDNVPYVLMRRFSAVLGLLTVILCYLTLRSSGVRPVIAFITAGLLLVENSFVTISRYILLDAPLVFFIAAAIYSFKKFETQKPFSFQWYRSLISCGVSLGLAFSSKWVGLFTIAWVGIMCLAHMWLLIGDLKVKSCALWKNAIARTSILIGVPVIIYLAMFGIHFSVLTNEGDGSAFMSSAFRSGLKGNTIPQRTVAPIGYGSIVSIRHINTQGGYLHSHKHYYQGGSKQQQITLYPHLDSNNDWVIEPYNFSTPDHFVPITDGTKIRLRHVNSHVRLHSHDEKPPVSERDWQKEVSGYGYEGFDGDANDDWIVEVVKHLTPEHAKEEVRALETIFRLRHAMSGHYLFSSPVTLPDWAFQQQEVTSASQGARKLTHWYIETNKNSMYQGDDEVSYKKPGFWAKFLESHEVMWRINSGLTGHHNWQSSPHEWPLLLRGINYWGRDHTQIYFLGNPVVWWTASACLVGFAIHLAISVLKWQTGAQISVNKEVFNYNYQMFTYFAGWALHYLPFHIMGRQLFLHHYLPAQYFAILGLGHFLNLAVTYSKKLSKPAYGFVALFFLLAIYTYHIFSPLIAGSQWTRAKCESSKLVKSWDYNCLNFLSSPEEYASYSLEAKAASVASPAETSPVAIINEAHHSPDEFKKENAAVDYDNVSPLEEAPPAETHKGTFELDEHGNLIQQDAPHIPEFEKEVDTGRVAEVKEELENGAFEKIEQLSEEAASAGEDLKGYKDAALEKAADAKKDMQESLKDLQVQAAERLEDGKD